MKSKIIGIQLIVNLLYIILYPFTFTHSSVACLLLTIINIVLIILENKPDHSEITKEPDKESEEKKELTAEEILDNIYCIISECGNIKPKKHGNWICLDLHNGYFFMADSWNGAIQFKSGRPLYEYWTGFSGDNKTSIYLGLSNSSWRGSDKLPLSVDEYKQFYTLAQKVAKERQGENG